MVWGRPASDPGAAVRVEAEPMERSAVSQLATATRRSLQPPSCPLSERRRAGRPLSNGGGSVDRGRSREAALGSAREGGQQGGYKGSNFPKGGLAQDQGSGARGGDGQ